MSIEHKEILSDGTALGTEEVNRVEVISNRGREISYHWVHDVRLSYQDNGRTLKVFLRFEEPVE